MSAASTAFCSRVPTPVPEGEDMLPERSITRVTSTP